MPKPSTDFSDLETPVMPPLDLRFDTASRQYHRDAARDPIAVDREEPSEHLGAQRT